MKLSEYRTTKSLDLTREEGIYGKKEERSFRH